MRKIALVFIAVAVLVLSLSGSSASRLGRVCPSWRTFKRSICVSRRWTPISNRIKVHWRWRKSSARKFGRPSSSTQAISPSRTAFSTRKCSASHVASSAKPRKTFPFREISSPRRSAIWAKRAEAVDLQLKDELVGVEGLWTAWKPHGT